VSAVGRLDNLVERYSYPEHMSVVQACPVLVSLVRQFGMAMQ